MSSMLIFLSILLMSIASLTSADDHKVTDADIKQLCSKTRNPGVCYTLLKSDNRTTHVDAKGLVLVSVELAQDKANKIQSALNLVLKTSYDPKLKNVYESCSKHYNNVIRDLQIIHQTPQTIQSTGPHDDVLAMVKDASKEVERCERVSVGISDDRAHIRKANMDFQLLLDIVRVAAENLKE